MRSLFQKLIALMIVLTLSIPFVTLAQQKSVQAETKVSAVEDAYAVSLEAEISAERDASSDINEFLWFGAGVGASIAPPLGIIAGCLATRSLIGSFAGGVAGLVPAYWIYTYESRPLSGRLFGKSPEYVAFYTDAYMSKAQSIRRKWTAAGAAT